MGGHPALCRGSLVSPGASNQVNTHTKGAFYRSFELARARELVQRIEFCNTPKHGSWLKIAEHELSCMTRQSLRRWRIRNLETLRAEIAARSTDVNRCQRGVDWQMKIRDARHKFVRPTKTLAVKHTSQFACACLGSGAVASGALSEAPSMLDSLRRGANTPTRRPWRPDTFESRSIALSRRSIDLARQMCPFENRRRLAKDLLDAIDLQCSPSLGDSPRSNA